MKKVQHFIPRFILKKFTNEGSFSFYNKIFGIFSKKVPSGSMYKEYFYEHDEFSPNEIEDLLASRESLYAPIIEKVIKHQQISLEEYKILTEFRHTTYYRSNEFVGFHTHRKARGENDWMARWDWRSLNFIYNPNDYDKDIKKSQLNAIQSVIDGKDAAYSLSLLTPICFVFTSKEQKFMISDSGSLCFGDEFEGYVIIVISPFYAIMFPRVNMAMKAMLKMGVDDKQVTVKYEEVDDDFVSFVNNKVLEKSFEYYIDPNLV